MRRENKSFDQVMDVFGFRIVVPKRDAVLPRARRGAFAVQAARCALPRFHRHSQGQRLPGLHTVLFGPYGSPIEVQIRTEEMDLIAERGIAAHWAVQDPSAQRHATARRARAQDWVRSLMDSQRAAGSSLEFLENVKVDLFPDEVYLFTPKGDILSLAAQRHRARLRLRGAHRRRQPCRGRARGQEAGAAAHASWPAARPWRSSPRRRPSPGPQWLEFVVSSKARTAIRHFLKRLEHEDAVDLGHRMLDRALEARETLARPRAAERLDRAVPRRAPLSAPGGVAGRHRAGQPHAGAGGAGAGAGRGRSAGWPPRRRRPAARQILITGTERGVLSFAQLLLSDSRRRDHGLPSPPARASWCTALECPNVAEYRKHPERWVPMAWDRDVQGDYRVALKLEVENKPGRAGPGRRRHRRGRIQYRLGRIPRARPADLGDASSASRCATASTWPM